RRSDSDSGAGFDRKRARVEDGLGGEGAFAGSRAVSESTDQSGARSEGDDGGVGSARDLLPGAPGGEEPERGRFSVDHTGGHAADFLDSKLGFETGGRHWHAAAGQRQSTAVPAKQRRRESEEFPIQHHRR